jgi:hypothetical protein
MRRVRKGHSVTLGRLPRQHTVEDTMTNTPPPSKPWPFPPRFAMSNTHRGQIWKRPPHIADNDNSAKKKAAAA